MGGVCGESREEETPRGRAHGRSSSWGRACRGELHGTVGAMGALSSQDLASGPGKTRWKI